MSINLLQQQTPSFLDRFIQWMLSYGKAILIITYSLSLFVFLFRFSLDSQLVDLHDSIKNYSGQISNAADAEKKFRNFQYRLAVAKAVDKEAATNVQHFSDMIEQTHGAITFLSLSVTDTDVHSVITTTNIAGLQEFVNNVKQLPYVEDISIASIQNKISTNEILADVSVTIKGTATAKGGK